MNTGDDLDIVNYLYINNLVCLIYLMLNFVRGYYRYKKNAPF